MRRILKKSDIDESVRLYKSGLLYADIATKFGVHWMVVRYAIKKAGVKSRSLSEVAYIMNSRLSEKERARKARAAHDAVRGKCQSFEHRMKIALAREKKGIGISRIESCFMTMLEKAGFHCVPQKAIGPYNVDIAITEAAVAVEIFGGQFHTTGRSAGRFRKRFDYLFNEGWHPIVIWVTRDYPLEIGAVEYVVAFAEKIGRGESMGRKGQMIRGGGKPPAIGKNKFDGRPVILRPNPRNKTTGRY